MTANMRKIIPGRGHRQRGAVAVVMAIAIIPLLLAVGVGIDYLRSVLARSELQAAVDAAALTAAAAGQSATDQEMEKTARGLLEKAKGTFTLKTVTPVRRDAAAGTLSFGATATIKTTFMRIVGLSSIEISANSLTQVPRPGPVELALVLDLTWSMDEIPEGDDRKKIDSLRDAATGLAESLMVSDDVAIGIVPFTTWINIGTSYNGEPWLDVPETKIVKAPKFLGCRETGQTCIRDGNAAPCKECKWDRSKEEEITYKFGGTVGLRATPNQENIDNPTMQFKGLIQTVVAPPIMELTKRGAEPNPVVKKIRSLQPINHEYVWDTFIPGGLIWGWNMLTSEMPLTLATTKERMDEIGLRKVLLLMTDGQNNVVIDETGLKFTLDSETRTTDQMTIRICNSIKKAGIEIYAVGFAVTDEKTKTMLKDCASPGHYFDTSTGTALRDAFNDISASLRRVRLLK